MSGKILTLYHFFYPDNAVSSMLFSDFAEGLADLGWDVTVLTSNRFCHDPKLNLRYYYMILVKKNRVISLKKRFDYSVNRTYF